MVKKAHVLFSWQYKLLCVAAASSIYSTSKGVQAERVWVRGREGREERVPGGGGEGK